MSVCLPSKLILTDQTLKHLAGILKPAKAGYESILAYFSRLQEQQPDGFSLWFCVVVGSSCL